MKMASSGSGYHGVPQSVSFSGSGFLATYQLGVAQCFLNHAPWILHTAPFVLGASAGSLVAAAVVCEMNMIAITDQMLYFVKHMKNFTLGPLNPSVSVFHWLESVLHKHLPADAHHLANGRLAVAVTRLSDGKQIIISEYQSREDVVQVLLCSCFVPGYCGTFPPSFKGVLYLDGGYSGIQPVMPGCSSPPLTVCPFAGDVDISPTDPPCVLDLAATGVILKGNMANCVRILNALYPMALETVEQGFHNGYRDALRYLENQEFADIGPLLVLCKASEQTFDFSSSSRSKTLEMDREEEKGVLAADENGSTETDNISKNQPLGFKPSSSEFLELFSNVLLIHMMPYLSMLGVPERVLLYLLLIPFMLCFDLIQNRDKLGKLLRHYPTFLYFTWQNVRHSTIFVSKILIWSLKKNMNDRFELLFILFHWLKFQAL